MPEWLSGQPGQWRLRVVAQPGAARTAVAGVHDGCLKLRIAAPPLEGRANEELVRWLARQLGLTRSQVRLAAGEASRRKSVALDAPIEAGAIIAALSSGLSPGSSADSPRWDRD